MLNTDLETAKKREYTICISILYPRRLMIHECTLTGLINETVQNTKPYKNCHSQKDYIIIYIHVIYTLEGFF